jgi:hypothetical protein
MSCLNPCTPYIFSVAYLRLVFGKSLEAFQGRPYVLFLQLDHRDSCDWCHGSRLVLRWLILIMSSRDPARVSKTVLDLFKHVDKLDIDRGLCDIVYPERWVHHNPGQAVVASRGYQGPLCRVDQGACIRLCIPVL